MLRRKNSSIVATLVACGLIACEPSPQAPSAVATSAQADQVAPWDAYELRQLERMSKPPALLADPTNKFADDANAARLGQRLFFDARASANGQISCASCHNPAHGFTLDSRLGAGLKSTRRHVPGLINVAYQRWFDWDGKADTLWSQSIRPLESPDEHGFSRVQWVQLVARDELLRGEYEAIFGAMPQELFDAARFPAQARPDPAHLDSPHHQAWETMTQADRDTINRATSNLLKSLAAYERKLISFDSKFDRYAQAISAGDKGAQALMSEQERLGLKLFMDKGRCVVCHSGPLFTDFTFHNLGLHTPSWLTDKDQGRWDGVTEVKAHELSAHGPYSDDPKGPRARWNAQLIRTPEDHGQFKTPSLRNVALTPPYMHGGHFQSLEEVVSFYNLLPGQAELGHREDSLKPLSLSDAEERALVAFLKTLNSAPLPLELLAPLPAATTGEEKKSEGE